MLAPASSDDYELIITNGVFDVLTVGHVDLFATIKRIWPTLPLHVLVNSDDSVRRLKGPTRPWNNERNRLDVIRALRDVDSAELFSEDTPLQRMESIQFLGWKLIIVKGRGYQAESIVAPVGAQCYVIGADLNVSSTATIEKMRHDRP